MFFGGRSATYKISYIADRQSLTGPANNIAPPVSLSERQFRRLRSWYVVFFITSQQQLAFQSNRRLCYCCFFLIINFSSTHAHGLTSVFTFFFSIYNNNFFSVSRYPRSALHFNRPSDGIFCVDLRSPFFTSQSSSFHVIRPFTIVVYEYDACACFCVLSFISERPAAAAVAAALAEQTVAKATSRRRYIKRRRHHLDLPKASHVVENRTDFVH